MWALWQKMCRSDAVTMKKKTISCVQSLDSSGKTQEENSLGPSQCWAGRDVREGGLLLSFVAKQASKPAVCHSRLKNNGEYWKLLFLNKFLNEEYLKVLYKGPVHLSLHKEKRTFKSIFLLLCVEQAAPATERGCLSLHPSVAKWPPENSSELCSWPETSAEECLPSQVRLSWCSGEPQSW